MADLPITREQAVELLKKYNKEEDVSDFNHYYESEAIMRAVAEKIGEDPDYYGMLGLLHDIDWGITKENTEDHLTKAPEILKEAGFDTDFIEIIVSHGYGFPCAGLQDKKREKKPEYALAASETLSGLIHALALMRPEKMEGMKVKSLKKKYKDKTFAKAINRDIIKEIENTGMTIEDFFEIAIKAVYDIKDKVGLS